MKKISQWFRGGVPFSVLLTSFAVGLSLCSVLIIGLTFYSTASGALKEQVDNLSDRQLTQAVNTLNERLSQLEAAGQPTVTDRSLKEYLYACWRQGKLDSAVYRELSVYVRREFVKAQFMINEIEELILLSDYGTISSKDTLFYNTTQTSFAEHFGWAVGQPQFYFPEPSDTPDSYYWRDDLRYYEQCLLYACPIAENGQVFGTLCYVVSPKIFTSSLEPHISAVVLHGSERIVYNSTELGNKDVLLSADDPDSTFFTKRVALHQYGLTVLQQANTSDLEQSLRSLRRISYLMALVVLVVSLITALLFSRSLTLPLIRIQKAMGQINGRSSLRKPLFQGKLSSRNYIRTYLTIIVLFSSFLFSFFSYRVYLKASNSILLTTAEASYRQSLNNTNATLSNLYYTSFDLAYDAAIQENLTLRAARQSETAFPESLIRKNLSHYTIPINLRILDTKRNVLFTTDYFIENESEPPEVITRKAKWQPVLSGSQNMVSMSLEIIDYSDLYRVGYLVLQADELRISRAYDYFSGDQHSIYLHSPDGLVLSSSDKSSIGNLLPAQLPGTALFSERLSNHDLVLTTYFDTSSMQRSLNQAVRSMIYFFLFLVLAVFIFNIFISNYLSRYFRDLGNTFTNISLDQADDFSQRYSIVSEINHTYAAFDEMQQRILSLMDENLKNETQRYELELDKQQMEMQLLQSQINPHFLYNTFEAINSMIASGDSAAAMRTLNELAEMLRYSTKNKAIMVPLREELKHARLYINIMAVHSRQLMVHYDVSPETYELPTVRFILQPILENAIHHGLKPKGGTGNIFITGKIANNKLVLVIRDDGVGMDEMTLKALNLSLTDKQAQTSIGLPNIANRLRLSHGDAGRLIIDSEEGMGCAVTIIQPIP